MWNDSLDRLVVIYDELTANPGEGEIIKVGLGIPLTGFKLLQNIWIIVWPQGGCLIAGGVITVSTDPVGHSPYRPIDHTACL